MSIIQEALNKATEDTKPAAPAPITNPKTKIEVVAVAAKPQKQAKPKAVKKRLPFGAILSSLILITLMAFAAFSVKQFLVSSRKGGLPTQDVTYKPLVRAAHQSSADSEPKPQTLIPASLKEIPGHPDLSLNGIMYLEKGPRAIINNSIVKEGDSVSSAKVVKINPKNVVLEYKEVEITLNLK